MNDDGEFSDDEKEIKIKQKFNLFKKWICNFLQFSQWTESKHPGLTGQTWMFDLFFFFIRGQTPIPYKP